jgi:hypothetical protein
MKHPHAWNWDRKGVRNLCYKHNQLNQVHEDQCRIESDRSCPVSVSPPSREDGNRSSYRNVFWFVEYRSMDEVKKPNNSEY